MFCSALLYLRCSYEHSKVEFRHDTKTTQKNLYQNLLKSQIVLDPLDARSQHADGALLLVDLVVPARAQPLGDFGELPDWFSALRENRDLAPPG